MLCLCARLVCWIAKNKALRALRPMGFQVAGCVTVLASTNVNECGASEHNSHCFSLIILCLWQQDALVAAEIEIRVIAPQGSVLSC